MKVWIQVDELWPNYTVTSKEEPWMCGIGEVEMEEDFYHAFKEAEARYFELHNKIREMYDK